jgi:hypothetical protein
MFGGELPAIMEVETMLQSKALVEKVRLTKTYYPHKNLGIIDLLDKDCSKRTAVEFLAGYYGVIREETLAIGDNHNDLEMLDYAGIGVVVANCVQNSRTGDLKKPLATTLEVSHKLCVDSLADLTAPQDQRDLANAQKQLSRKCHHWHLRLRNHC